MADMADRISISGFFYLTPYSPRILPVFSVFLTPYSCPPFFSSYIFAHLRGASLFPETFENVDNLV
jgi:hypothetical protein